MSKKLYKYLEREYLEDARTNEVLVELPRQAMSEILERRTRRTWKYLRDLLEARKAKEGGLSEMNERTLAAAIKNCEEKG